MNRVCNLICVELSHEVNRAFEGIEKQSVVHIIKFLFISRFIVLLKNSKYIFSKLGKSLRSFTPMSLKQIQKTATGIPIATFTFS